MRTKMNVAMTIAGSDSGGGAGIQADLKTFAALSVFGVCAVTAVTAQNPAGVRSIQGIRPEVVRDQIEAVFTGFPVRAIKTGMLFSAAIAAAVATAVAEAQAAHPPLPLVVDPVLQATSGRMLSKKNALRRLMEAIIPKAAIVTPNIPECQTLTGLAIRSAAEQEKAAERFFQLYRVPVLVKGGHLAQEARDHFFDGRVHLVFSTPRVAAGNRHGTGCTLSAAITAGLACGLELTAAVRSAKEFIQGALVNGIELADDVLLLDHFWNRKTT